MSAGEAVVEAPAAAEKTETGSLAGTLQSLMATMVIVVFVTTFVVQAFQIPSESMENTLLIGDYLLVDKVTYGGGSRLDSATASGYSTKKFLSMGLRWRSRTCGSAPGCTICSATIFHG